MKSSENQPYAGVLFGRIGEFFPEFSATLDDGSIVAAPHGFRKCLDVFDAAAAEHDIVGHHGRLDRWHDLLHDGLPLFRPQLLKAFVPQKLV